MDGDDDIDLLFGSRGIVGWLENQDGNGTFAGIRVVTDETSSPTTVVAADVDGDNDQDVIAATGNFFDQQIWYENIDGKGNFGNARPIGSSAFMPYIMAADLDADGDVDLIGASFSLAAFVVYENSDGLGTFTQHDAITSKRPSSFSLHDLDGDGDLDALIGTNAWYENVSNGGTFDFRERVVRTSIGLQLTELADIDGDGDLDAIALANHTLGRYRLYGTLAWLENLDGKGDFGDPKMFYRHDSVGVKSVGPISVVDIDGDGDVDVLSAVSEFDTNLRWFENTDGLGTMNAGHRVSDDKYDIGAIGVADINADGTPDFISTSGINDSISWYPNQLPATIGNRQPIVMGAYGDRSVRIMDIDGDQDLDIVTGRSWFENRDGLGRFDESHHDTPGWALGQPVDIDGDGDLDRLSLLERPHDFDDAIQRSELVWFENLDGNVLFERRSRIDLIDRYEIAHAPVAIDFDGDGDQDVVLMMQTNTVWYENVDGLGNYSDAQAILLPDEARYEILLADDIDSDGDSDLLFVGSKSVDWRETTGGVLGAWHEITVDVLFSRPTAYLSDLDGDQYLDLLFASTIGPLWLRNDGNGNFGIPIKIGNVRSKMVLPADVDLDGDLDVVSYSDSSNIDLAVWHENLDGQGDFGPVGSHHVIAQATFYSVAVEDFDGDGDLDFAGRSSGTDRGMYYENTNGGEFGPEQLLLDLDHEIRLASGDIDGDGDTDLVTVATLDDPYKFSVRWYDDRLVGDSNGDGRFDSSDLVHVFTVGKYNDNFYRNTTFDDGDWNQDGEFDSNDLVVAFQAGQYVSAATQIASQFAGAVDSIFAADNNKLQRARAFVA